MNSFSSPSNPYSLLLISLSFIPTWHYLIAFAILSLSFLYNFLEFHFFQDLFFGGSPVLLTRHPSSHLYDGVVSKCRLLHGRYLATPWLSSPPLQTVFMSFFGRPPVFKYRRQLFNTSDGGTIALDWLMSSDVSDGALHMDGAVSKDESTPLVIVIPGLTSDSSAAELDLEIRDKKGTKNLVADHLSRITHRGDSEEEQMPIKEEFPDEQLFVVQLSPWFADFANYRATGMVPSDFTWQQQKKFFRYVSLIVSTMLDGLRISAQ